MEKDYLVCCACGALVTEEDGDRVDGDWYCQDCLDRLTLVCEDCGERFMRVENCRTEAHPLCEGCRDEDYTYCAHCDCLISNSHAFYLDDDSDAYCYDCYSELGSEAIHNYSYKPDPIFYGSGSRYLGVELEIDGGGEEGCNASKVLDAANFGDERIYCKHDGSLSNGFEIVTHPMTLAYHEKSMPWAEVTDMARRLGYRSHKAETCGLHVHVNRGSLGRTVAAQEAAIGRILFFMEKNWNELLVFSRRTQRQLERWAARYGYKDHPKEMLEEAKKQRGDRYVCLNLTNADTIEFRIFRGTLKLNTLIATLQLVNLICDAATFYSDQEMRELSWSGFAAGITDAELIQYLKERRLYVNEPVDGEVDE